MGVICVIWYKIFTVFQNYWGGSGPPWPPLVSATDLQGKLGGGGGEALHPPRCAELASTLNDLCVLSQISQNEVLRPIFTQETFPRAENVPKILLLKVEILCRPITFYKILSGNGA